MDTLECRGASVIVTPMHAPLPEWTDWVNLIAGVFAAGGTVALAVIAAVALKGLRNQRADECIAAAHDLEAAVGRCLAAKKQLHSQKEFWPTYDDVWASARQLQQKVSVAARYHKTSKQELDAIPQQIRVELENLKGIAGSAWNEQIAEALKTRIANRLAPIYRL